MGNAFQFRTVNLNGNPTTGDITPDELMAMSRPEFLDFRNRLVNVRFRRRYDLAIWEAVIITTAMVKVLFRAGVGQNDFYASSNTEYKKSRVHTNMTRNGEFPQGSLTIIEDIVAKKAFFGGVPTTITDGAITNPKAVYTGAAANDPALNLYAWVEQVQLTYKEDDSEIVKGLLCEFPQNDGQSGYLGNTVGGIAQNAFNQSSLMAGVRVLNGGEDFSVEVAPLCNYDASAGSGIGQVIVQKVELQTIELITTKV